MKKLLFPLLLTGLLGACSKKDDPAPAPTYADYTPISGQFSVDIDGAFRPTGQDTTAVLSNLQLRYYFSVSSGQAVEVYEIKGDVSRHEAMYMKFIIPQTRTGTGPWAALEVDTKHYLQGQVYDQGFGSGSLGRVGEKFTADFDVSAIQGVLR